MSLLSSEGPSFVQSWTRLSKTISGLLKQSPEPLSEDFSGLYHTVYRLCAVPPSEESEHLPERVYTSLRQLLTGHVVDICGKLHLVWRGVDDNYGHECMDGDTEQFLLWETKKEDPSSDNDDEDDDVDVTRDIRLLLVYEKYWKAYAVAIQRISKLFSYLDRCWVHEKVQVGVAAGEKSICKTSTMAMVVWRKELLGKIGDRLANSAFRLVSEERRRRLTRTVGSFEGDTEPLHMDPVRMFLLSVLQIGKDISSLAPDSSFADVNNSLDDKFDFSSVPGSATLTPLRTDLRESLHERKNQVLAFYRKIFESKYLALTFKFYETESDKMLALYKPRDYLRSVEDEIVKKELEIANTYLDRATFPSLICILDAAFIGKHADILYDEAGKLLSSAHEHCAGSQSQDFRDLAQIYKLLSRISTGTKSLQTLLRRLVVTKGRQAVAQYENISSRPDLERASQFVEAAYKVYARFEHIIATAFKGDSSFHLALDQGCNRFLNVPSFAALTAAYCHVVLSSSDHIQAFDEQPATGIEARLAKAVRIFRYLDSKEEFRRCYAQYLCKRLLARPSRWRSAEESMISRLRKMCGYEYISRMQRMLNDLLHSHRETALYSSTHPVSPPEISVYILTSTAWPIRSVTAETDEQDAIMISTRLWNRLPNSLHVTTRFRDYYLSRHSGRTLTYVPHLSRVVLRAHDIPCAISTLPPSEHMTLSFDIDCGPLVASVLLLFADRGVESISLDEMVENLQIPAPFLSRALRCLVRSKLLKVAAHPGASGCETGLMQRISPWLSERTMFGIGCVRNGIETMTLDDQIEDYEDDHVSKKVKDDRRREGSTTMQAAVVSILKRRRICTLNDVIVKLAEKGRPGGVEDVRIALAILEDKEYVKRVVNQDQEEAWEYLP